MAERGRSLDHSTIARWVLGYAPELSKRLRRRLRRPGSSWRVDETYVRVGGAWTYPRALSLGRHSPGPLSWSHFLRQNSVDFEGLLRWRL
jgi:hypothetical protein